MVPTGISYPIIITDVEGDVSVGDELVAYANGQVVGATRIVDLTAPVVISAWGGFHDYGIDLDGYTVGDQIDLRLYSLSDNKEMKVEMSLDNNQYGSGVFASGTIQVMDMLAVPEEYVLVQNYPNPFNPSTTISFSVPSDGHVEVSVYDITGRLVTTLVDANLNSGYHNIIWDATNQASGVYYIQVTSNGQVQSQKVMLLK